MGKTTGHQETVATIARAWYIVFSGPRYWLSLCWKEEGRAGRQLLESVLWIYNVGTGHGSETRNTIIYLLDLCEIIREKVQLGGSAQVLWMESGRLNRMMMCCCFHDVFTFRD